MLSLDQSAFMTTRSGTRVHFADPDPTAITIEDIAHALSHLCRFTGHTKYFYSVARHSILASHYVQPEFALEALLHDAHEAYVGDLSRPLKNATQGYREIADRIDRVIRRKFGLCEICSLQVKDVDAKLLVGEAKVLLTDHYWVANHPYVDLTDLKETSPTLDREMFLARFEQLS